jgi:phospholipid/cholesterol/gamma-HCH transport system substrate-binding protein
VGQLQTITRELNLALEGREDAARSVFRQIEELMGQLDQNKGAIVDAIESLNRLAISAKEQIPTIDATLEELPSALRTIDAQRGDLVRMLQALNRLGDVGVRVIEASKDSTIASFRQLVPVLTELANSGDNFAKAFHVFLTYPFVDEVVGRDPQVARNLHMGDFTNLSVKLDIALPGDDGGGPPIPDPPDLPVDCTTLGELPDDIPFADLPEDLCQKARRAIRQCINNPTVENCRRVPGEIVQAVCEEAPADVPLPGRLCPDGSGGGGGGGNDGPLPDQDLPDGPINLPRVGFGPTDTWSARGPTMGDLMKAYDPALVALLVPGMVTR